MSSRVPSRRRRRPAASAVGAALAIVALTACAPDPPRGVVGVTVTGCGTGEAHGSGIVIEPGLVLTAAHVIKGAREITVTNGDQATPGEIVAFDPEMDLALVALGRSFGMPTPLRGEAVDDEFDGATGQALVVRDGIVHSVPITVRRRINIRTEDIYIDGETLRPGYELDGQIQSGDSGGAVVIGGEVIGVLWARSNRLDARAYAIDPIRAGTTIATQRRTGDLSAVDLTRCT